MDTSFPFGFPLPTAMYLVLYVVTLIVHVLFMNYVLAGSAYLAVHGLIGRSNSFPDTASPTRSGAMVLRDWLPFALGVAITAGVAPLLFVQILYQQPFYTANLLLFHRWMAILPVLIIAFYLLYLYKSKRVAAWGLVSRLLIGVVAFACFAFVAYSWTENHLLSTRPDAWVDHWANQRAFYFEPAIIPRLGVWFIGALPTMALLLSWQLRHYERQGRTVPAGEPRRLALIALVGLTLAGGCALIYDLAADRTVQKAVNSALALPYLLAAICGVVLQVVGWFDLARQNLFCKRALLAITIGLLLTVVGMTVVRESIRLHSLAAAMDYNLQSLFDHHARSAEVGGMATFLIFFAINIAVVTWCVRAVKRCLEAEKPAS